MGLCFSTLPDGRSGIGRCTLDYVPKRLRRHCHQLALPVFAGCVAGMILICWLRHTTDHSDRVVQTLGFSMIALAYGALLVLSLGPLAGLFSTRILRIFGKY